MPINGIALDGSQILYAGNPLKDTISGVPQFYPVFDVAALNPDGSVATGFGQNGVASATHFVGNTIATVNSLAVGRTGRSWSTGRV